MRKSISLVLCLLLCCLPLLGMAESTQRALIFTGKVEAPNTSVVYAPFGGTVRDFTLRVGDRVDRSTTLLSLDSTKVYAPISGTVRGVFARTGDSAAFVQNRYGALCYIEPDVEFIIQASTSQGYSSEENRTLHLGETVYMRATNDTKREAEGRITMINADVFTIEVLSGDLKLRDTATIFRDEEFESESRIGRGVVTRAEPIPVTAEGSVLTISAREGVSVARGDVLFGMASGSLDGMRAPNTAVKAPQDSVVASVEVMSGQMVNKNQALVTLYRMDTVQLVSSISELDLPSVAIGDPVRIEFDSIPGTSYEGTIASISSIGTKTQDYAEYTVYIDCTPDDQVRLGMSGTAYPVEE